MPFTEHGAFFDVDREESEEIGEEVVVLQLRYVDVCGGDAKIELSDNDVRDLIEALQKQLEN